jgi:L-ribulose-5-phosphate 3-epimerase
MTLASQAEDCCCSKAELEINEPYAQRPHKRSFIPLQPTAATPLARPTSGPTRARAGTRPRAIAPPRTSDAPVTTSTGPRDRLLQDWRDRVGGSSSLDTSTCVRLSVITDEIDAGLEPALDVCAELGIRAVELRTVDRVSIVDKTPGVLRAMRQELDGRGFRVCAIASPFLKCDRGDDPLAQVRVHERALEAAMVMSAPVVRAFGYWREADPSAALSELGSALSRAAARASDAGVTLALENEHECNVATSVEARAALDAADSPHLRLIWDPGNAAMLDLASFSGLGGLETIYDEVAHVHLKDVSASGSWTRVGEGIVDFAALLRYLASAGYEGYLSFETHYQRDGSGELSTRDCVAALRSIAAQADVELGA